MLDVCLLGTGGMMPLPNRWLTSLMTRYNGSNLVIDCGEGTQITMKMQGWSFKDIDQILITHFHADHISGLPGLLLAIGNSDRKKPLTIVGPKGLERVVKGLRVIAPELPYKINIIELKENIQKISLNGYEITAYKVNHKIACFGYTIDILRLPKFDIEKARSLELPVQYWSKLQNGENIEYEGRMYEPSEVMGKRRKGIRVGYCTDTRPTKNIIESVKDADLFVCEGMYPGPIQETNAVAYKHMIFEEAASIAKEANVKELWLTHFSPSLVKPKDALPNAKRIFENSYLGYDRKTKLIKFED